MSHPLHAVLDPLLQARVIARRPLLYAAGADPRLDRPAHVRSASGLARFAGRIAVIQDDANFIALLESPGASATAITLPAGEGGARQFDDGRGNKRFKLDLESCVPVERRGESRLLAFGSGSLPPRECVVEVRISPGEVVESAAVRVVDASALYAVLRADPGFCGSQLNVEGAAIVDGRLRLFNRGNGVGRGELMPVNASCDLELEGLLRGLDGEAAPPPVTRIRAYSLGELGGVRLTFTDAAALAEGVLYAAAAERSPNALDDGPVAGCALGVIAGGEARYTLLAGEDESPFQAKVEGILPDAPGRLLAVIDRDDPAAASELCVVALEGDWPESLTQAPGGQVLPSPGG
jgi:hypothetical protein